MSRGSYNKIPYATEKRPPRVTRSFNPDLMGKRWTLEELWPLKGKKHFIAIDVEGSEYVIMGIDSQTSWMRGYDLLLKQSIKFDPKERIWFFKTFV